MAKIFISQPMRGLSEKEIIKARDSAIKAAREMFDDDIEILPSFFINFEGKPLQYLAKALMLLAEADCAIFVNGWQNARGCKIEHMCAKEYGVNILEI